MISPDGIYLISIPELDEDDFGPPNPGDNDDEDFDMTPLGHIHLNGDTVTNLDHVPEIDDLIYNCFRREGKQIRTEQGDTVFADYHIPITNGEPGFGEAFMEMLVFFDYWFDKVEN